MPVRSRQSLQDKMAPLEGTLSMKGEESAIDMRQRIGLEKELEGHIFRCHGFSEKILSIRFLSYRNELLQ